MTAPMPRVLAAVCGLILLGWLAAPALGAEVTFSLGEVKGSPGKDVRAAVRVAGAKGLMGGAFEVEYDPLALEARGAEPGPWLAGDGAALDAGAAEPGRLEVVFSGAGALDGDGVLMHLVFHVRGTPGQTTPLALRALRAFGGEGRPELVAVGRDGRFTVAEPAAFPVLVFAAAALVLVYLFARSRRRPRP